MEQKIFLQVELQEAGLSNSELDLLMFKVNESKKICPIRHYISLFQCGQGNAVLRSEINRWDNNHIDVSMLVSTNCKMRKDLQEVHRELQKWKDKCENLGQDNLRLRNKIAEAQAEDKEIEQLYGNVANGIETRHGN